MEYPLVTVIIPVYNREETIVRAIDSVLQQTYKNIEVIVIDDCSTDSTLNIVKKYNDNRIKIICLSHNYGANFARNRGIENAHGEFIAFQDSDDEWLEDKLETQIKYMLEENFDASFSPYILREGQLNQIIPYDFQNCDLYRIHLKEQLKKGNVVGTPTLIVRRNIFSKIGMFNEEMKRLQDYEFVIRVIKKFRLGYIDRPLVKAYRMEKSISTNKKALLDAYKILVEKYFDFVELENIIDCIFNYIMVFQEGEINWKEFNEFVDIIKSKQDPEEEEKLNKLIIENIYKRYFPIKNMLEEWYYFFINNIKNGQFAIYGAGTWGQRAYYDIKKNNCIPKYFLVTKGEENKELKGIPIVELSKHIDKEIPVVVAVSWEKQNELIRNLQNLGISRFCIYPFC